MQITGWRLYAPWLDRKGAFRPLGAACLALLLLPALVIALDALAGRLGPKPWTQAVHDSGTWSLRILLVSLAVSPLRRIFGWNAVIGLRRMIGLGALAYGLAHLMLYCVDLAFDWGLIVSEIATRFYLIVGMAALAGLVALGITSTDSMIRRMGARRWQRLHALVYPIALLALLHFALQSKIDVTEPVLMAGFFGLLMLYRLLAGLRLKPTPLVLAAVALACGLATALAETAWYAFTTGASAWLVFQANGDVWSDPAIALLRPGHWVALAGLALALASALRGGAPAGGGRRERAA